MKDSKLVRAAQAGGASKSKPVLSKSPGKSGDGLKQAWSDQTKRPSVLADMSAAKKKVR